MNRIIITSPIPQCAIARWMRFCRSASLRSCWRSAPASMHFRRASDNLYERVRALFFLYAIHRFHLPAQGRPAARGFIPFDGYDQLLQRRFEEAIDTFLTAQSHGGPERRHLQRPGRGVSPAGLPDTGRPGAPQRALGARQPVDVSHRPSRRPSAARPSRAAAAPAGRWRLFPILRETHPGAHGPLPTAAGATSFSSAWISPKAPRAQRLHRPGRAGPRRRRRGRPSRPICASSTSRVLRLVSVDLGATADITHLAEVFDFAKDYLGLLKAAVIAAGLRAAGHRRLGAEPGGSAGAASSGPGHGIELVSNVNDIPKGSRLAVSTSLLASPDLSAACVPPARRTPSPARCPRSERRLVAARAIWASGWRFRRRLAGFRRAVARHEAD